MSMRYSSLSRSLSFKPTISIYSNSFSSIKSPQITPIFNPKDWLSPNELVKIFQTLKDPSKTLALFNQVSNRKDYKPNEALYTAIINKLALAKDFDGIENVMKMIKMKKNEKKCNLSEDFFYNVIRLYGLLAGRINLAIDTLFDMPNYNCWPTVKTFNFVLNLLVNTKQYDVIHEVYVGGFKLGVVVDVCSLNILIKGLCGCGDLDAAFQVLDEFSKQKCRPNVRTYSTLIHKLCDKRRVDEAFGLFEKMEREDIEPDTVIFNILISGLRKQGRVEEAIELMHKMNRKGCEPNAGTYLEILYGLIDDAKFVEAKILMGRMISKGEKPSFDSFKKLILGLCKHSLVDDLDWVLKKMVRHGFVPKMGMWREIIWCLFPRDGSGYTFTCISFEEILKN